MSSNMNIIQGFPIPQKDYFKVYARSITYNQAKYIEDCLNGVAMQETNFPFVHHVIDDASTDGEQNVIKTWMDRECDMEHAEYYDNDICTITLVKNKKNPNCTLAAYFLKKNMYGNPKKRELFTPWREVCPYEALCEGDDYWIDPKKLQKQVDYLDQNQDFVLVSSRAQTFIQETKETKPTTNHTSTKFRFIDIILSNDITTCTVLYRTSLLNNYYKEITKRWLLGDYPLWLYYSQHGRIFCMADCTSTYRILKNSASHFVDSKKAFEFKKSSMDCTYYFAKKYGLSAEEKKLVDEIEAKDLYYKGKSAQSVDLMNLCIQFKKEHDMTVTTEEKFLCKLFSSSIGVSLFRFALKFR